jgi:hypothetical protein
VFAPPPQVSVDRSGPSPVRGYVWTITFDQNPGDFPAGSGTVATLEPSPAMLTGTGASVVQSSTSGGFAALTGVWHIDFTANVGTTHSTGLLRFDATQEEVATEVSYGVLLVRLCVV